MQPFDPQQDADAYLEHGASGDNFVDCGKGHTHWGSYGAAGALVRNVDPQGQERYFMMLRSPHVQQGGTWGIPGGARNAFEPPHQAAFREASEEGVPVHNLTNLRPVHVNDHGGWQYHTVGADSPEMFEPGDLDWEHDDYGWFTPEEIHELPLHPGFRESWNQLYPPKRLGAQRVSQGPDEMCVMLDIPEAARKHIHAWVLEQDWPEGTELHEPEKYHITLMYTPGGRSEHEDADWIEHMGKARVKVTHIDVFPKTPEDRYPYVLRIDSPEVKRHGDEMQALAEEHGLEITHFDGGYKPHLTVGYGQTDKINADDIIPLTFEAGPSFLAPPREDEEPATKKATGSTSERGEGSVVLWNLDGHDGNNITARKLAVKEETPPAATKALKDARYRDATGKDRCGTCKMNGGGFCWGYGNEEIESYKVCDSYEPAPGYHEAAELPASPQEAQLLDDLSLRSVAHNLHYKFEEGVQDPGELKSYAERLLRMVGYPPDDMTTMAALQAWQTMYPGDKALEKPQEMTGLAPGDASGNDQAPATTPTQSWGYGTVSSWPATVWYRDEHRYAEFHGQPLYHWADISELEKWMDPSHTGPGFTYLTDSGDDPAKQPNPDVPYSDQPVRITIDGTKLDPSFFDPQYEGWNDNHLYLAPIPQNAILEIKSFKAPKSWDLPSNTEPTPEDRWPEFGQRSESEIHQYGVPISNDYV